MRSLLFGVTLLVVVAAVPVSLTYCAAWALRDRLRARNNVFVVPRVIHTPRVTLTTFVPRGRA